jgi:hypothetical protein
MDDGSDARAIIQRSIEAYAALDSYQDAGHVESVRDPGSAREYLSRIRFETRLKRPNLFRIEWLEETWAEKGLESIWSDGKSVHQKYTFTGLEEVSDLVQDLGVAGTSSDGVADIVPVIFLPELNCHCRIELTSFTRLGCVEFNGENCHHLRQIRILPMGPMETEIWISIERNIFRKVKISQISDHARFFIWSLQKEGKKVFDDPLEAEAAVEKWRQKMKDIGQAEIDKNPEMEQWRKEAFLRSSDPSCSITEINYNEVSLNQQIPDESFQG